MGFSSDSVLRRPAKAVFGWAFRMHASYHPPWLRAKLTMNCHSLNSFWTRRKGQPISKGLSDWGSTFERVLEERA